MELDAAPSPVLERFDTWPGHARRSAFACRAIFHAVAAENAVGVLEESLKWGQPAWRPRRSRTGATLRMNWSPDRADRLALFVDCKTDLAARMHALYPDLPGNDGRRELALSLSEPVPEQAVAHLAQMTFTYHRK